MTRLIANSDIVFALGYTPVNQTAMAGYVLTSSLAAVAVSGAYSDLVGRPAQFVLAPAAAGVLGGVKPGSGITIAGDGTISATGTGSGGAVSSVAGRTGAITLTVADVSGAASLISPSFSGAPTAPTPALGTVSTQLATCQFVANAVTASTTGVSTFNARSGAIVLTSGDVTSALGYTPTASGAGVASFNSRGGAVVLTSGDLTTALGFTPYNSSNPSNYQTAAQVNATVAAATPTGTSRNVRTVTIAGNVTVSASDYLIKINKTTPEVTAITLEANPVSGSQHVIKDGAGNSDSYPITITPAGTATIDGQPNFVLNVPTGAITMLYDGAQWSLV